MHTKHINTRHHFMRDAWESSKLQVHYIKPELNEADICTKNLPPILHTKHQNTICSGNLAMMAVYEALDRAIWREGVGEDENNSFGLLIKSILFHLTHILKQRIRENKFLMNIRKTCL